MPTKDVAFLDPTGFCRGKPKRIVNCRAFVFLTGTERSGNPKAEGEPSVEHLERNLLFKALSFAANKHRHQRRKGSPPIAYINHPIAVADLLVRTAHIDDPKIIAAALIHDTIEDTALPERNSKGNSGR